ncbi:hypothetical protein ACFXJ5_39455 [Streptomyces sp. NPDC059373]
MSANWPARADTGLAVAGATSVTGHLGDEKGLGEQGPGAFGHNYLFRQGASLGGGSTEMSRNIISERLLKMPREFAADRDIPFSQVKQGR